GKRGGLIALFLAACLSALAFVPAMPEPRLSPCKGHASQNAFQRPSDPMLGQSAAKMNHLLGHLRSHKGPYELVDALAAIARRRRKTLLGCAGNRESLDKAVVEHSVGWLAAA